MQNENITTESNTDLELRNSNNELALPQGYSMFKKPTKEGIKIIGSPFMYKADCSSLGQFKTKSDEMLGKTLQMELLNITRTEGKFFIYEKQEWLELLFIDKDNTVSTCLFKGQSIGNFVDCQQDIFKKGLAMSEVIITATMEKRYSEKADSNYHAVKFTFVENTSERIKEMQEFISDYPGLLGYSLLAEMQSRDEDSKTDKQTGEINQNAKPQI